jgi:vacuolar protein sorting-associated protein 41
MGPCSHGSLEEPQLKYRPLGEDVAIITARDRVTCLCLSDKILAIGTAEGNVHVLDYSGDQAGRGGGHVGSLHAWAHCRPWAPQVRCLKLHSGCVNELSFDKQEEHIASCSDDGTVVVGGPQNGSSCARGARFTWHVCAGTYPILHLHT